MKFRKDFVTNSSSSSYTCEICGNTESGWDYCLSEVAMVQCVNGHTYCEDEMLPIPRKEIIRTILEQEAETAKWCKEHGRNVGDLHDMEDLEEMSDEAIKYELFNLDDGRCMIPEECCPICQFIEYSEKDLCSYFLKKHGVSRDEVFEKVKAVNKRRKKLYDSEYITEVCQRFSLNPIEMVAGWKTEFGTYSAFKKYIRS